MVSTETSNRRPLAEVASTEEAYQPKTDRELVTSVFYNLASQVRPITRGNHIKNSKLRRVLTGSARGKGSAPLALRGLTPFAKVEVKQWRKKSHALN